MRLINIHLHRDEDNALLRDKVDILEVLVVKGSPCCDSFARIQAEHFLQERNNA